MLQELESKLSLLGKPLTLQRRFVSCYGKQVLTHTLWLQSGKIILDQPRKELITHTKPGLYFYDEFISGQTVPYKIEVMPGSSIYILTKSELALIGLAIPA